MLLNCQIQSFIYKSFTSSLLKFVDCIAIALLNVLHMIINKKTYNIPHIFGAVSYQQDNHQLHLKIWLMTNHCGGFVQQRKSLSFRTWVRKYIVQVVSDRVIHSLFWIKWATHAEPAFCKIDCWNNHRNCNVEEFGKMHRWCWRH